MTRSRIAIRHFSPKLKGHGVYKMDLDEVSPKSTSNIHWHFLNLSAVTCKIVTYGHHQQ